MKKYTNKNADNQTLSRIHPRGGAKTHSLSTSIGGVVIYIFMQNFEF